jgi:hypothetical protein
MDRLEDRSDGRMWRDGQRVDQKGRTDKGRKGESIEGEREDRREGEGVREGMESGCMGGTGRHLST